MVKLYGPCLAQECCFTPGRVLRGRWGSIDEFENFFIRGMLLWGEVFKKLFADDMSKKRKPKGPGADMEQSYQETSRQWKRTTLELTNNYIFKGMVLISNICKEPLFYFHKWAQKQLTLTNVKKREALDHLPLWIVLRYFGYRFQNIFHFILIGFSVDVSSIFLPIRGACIWIVVPRAHHGFSAGVR